MDTYPIVEAEEETKEDGLVALWIIARYDDQCMRGAALEIQALDAAKDEGLPPSEMIARLCANGIRESEVYLALRRLFERNLVELSGEFKIRATK